MENEFSLNDWIICELTPRGRALLVEHYKNNPEGMTGNWNVRRRTPCGQVQYEFQISEFAYIFGKDLWAGAENVTVNSRFDIIREQFGNVSDPITALSNFHQAANAALDKDFYENNRNF